MSAQSTPGPLASRQGTKQETYAGPWIVSHEGSPVIKRELRFVEDGAPAGWELLSGDTSQLEALIARAPDLAAENEALRKRCDELEKLVKLAAGVAHCAIRRIDGDISTLSERKLRVALREVRESCRAAFTTHPARGEDGAR